MCFRGAPRKWLRCCSARAVAETAAAAAAAAAVVAAPWQVRKESGARLGLRVYGLRWTEWHLIWCPGNVSGLPPIAAPALHSIEQNVKFSLSHDLSLSTTLPTHIRHRSQHVCEKSLIFRCTCRGLGSAGSDGRAFACLSKIALAAAVSEVKILFPAGYKLLQVVKKLVTEGL